MYTPLASYSLILRSEYDAKCTHICITEVTHMCVHILTWGCTMLSHILTTYNCSTFCTYTRSHSPHTRSHSPHNVPTMSCFPLVTNIMSGLTQTSCVRLHWALQKFFVRKEVQTEMLSLAAEVKVSLLPFKQQSEQNTCGFWDDVKSYESVIQLITEFMPTDIKSIVLNQQVGLRWNNMRQAENDALSQPYWKWYVPTL